MDGKKLQRQGRNGKEWYITGKKTTFERHCDNQCAAVCARCRICGGEIFIGQSYYAVPGGPVCPSCLGAYARAYFLPELCAATPGAQP